MQPDLVIIGTGGFAKECGVLARQLDPGAERWSRLRYCSAEAADLRQLRPGGEIDLLDDDLQRLPTGTNIVIGIGHAPLRARLGRQLQAMDRFIFPNLIHPRADWSSEGCQMGEGNFIASGVVVSCDTKLGSFNLLNWNVTVGHDCDIGHANVINPGSSVSGHVRVENACLLGTGCRVLERLHLTTGIRVGAGAVVTRSLLEAGTYVGIPARRSEA